MSRNRTEQPNIASDRIDVLEQNEVFVFGSNLAGHHIGGAAKAAHVKFGAQWGIGVGLTGRSYAIPTMQGGIDTIKPYVEQFIEFAKRNPEYYFLVTRIGCGIAGFKEEEIAPLFKEAVGMHNVYLPRNFYDIIVAPYLKHCFYYGKDVPKDMGADVGHKYEPYWVHSHFAHDNYLLDETIYYIREGLGNFCSEDGVPLSMKSILYNRFCHWGWCETPDTFRRWYESIDYTNTKRNAKEHGESPKSYYNPMLVGTILGDMAASVYKFNSHKTTDLNLYAFYADYTEDTIMTIAVADWLLNDKRHTKKGLVSYLQKWKRKYPNPMGVYDGNFSERLQSDNLKPNKSWGNGAAVCVSAVGFALATLEETLKVAKITAEVIHNHPVNIKGAQATVAAIFLARRGKTKEEIRSYIIETFGYDLNRTCGEIRPTYSFSCEGSVPKSIIAFIESKDYEDALRLCISLGVAADTIGAITGAIAGAYYHQLPYASYTFAMDKLPNDMKEVISRFNHEYDRLVSSEWKDPECDTETLINKVKSGEIFI